MLEDEMARTNLDRIESDLRVAKLQSEKKLLTQKLEAREQALSQLQNLCDSRGEDLAALREELELKAEELREHDERMDQIVAERFNYKSDMNRSEREIEHITKSLN